MLHDDISRRLQELLVDAPKIKHSRQKERELEREVRRALADFAISQALREELRQMERRYSQLLLVLSRFTGSNQA